MDKSSSKLSRRTLFAGVAGVGAVAAVASLAPALRSSVEPSVQPVAAPARGGGYRLSEHVKHYYRTTGL